MSLFNIGSYYVKSTLVVILLQINHFVKEHCNLQFKKKRLLWCWKCQFYSIDPRREREWDFKKDSCKNKQGLIENLWVQFFALFIKCTILSRLIIRGRLSTPIFVSFRQSAMHYHGPLIWEVRFYNIRSYEFLWI